MAIPFLSNIDLNKKQALNLVLHNKNSAPSSPADGQMYFNSDSGTMKAYVYLGSSKGWTNIGGDIEGVDITAGSGLTGTVTTTSGTHTQQIDIGNGDGITVSADKISVTVDDTTIGLSASDNSGSVMVKDNGIDLAQLKHQTANTVLKMNGSGVPTAGTIDNANITDDAVDGDKIADDAINSEHYVDGSIDTDHIGNDQVTYAKIQNVAANNVLLGNIAGADSIVAELGADDLTALIKDVLNNNMGTVTIGDSNDTVAIPGNLQVTGTTTTNNVETVSTSNGVVFEGTVADGHDGTLISVAADSGKTYTLPNITGYVPILTNDPGTTAISATAAEINKIDGFTGDHNDLNYAKDLRATGVTATEYDTLDGITATTTELNILDGGTSAASSITIADADRFVMNDAGTMKQIAASDVKAYVETFIATREFVVELDATESSVSKSGNTYTVTHGLGTRNVLCQVIEHGGDNTASTSGDKKHQTVHVDIDRPDNAGNTVDVMFGGNVTDGAYKILITKIG